jgi:hypothetical protein
MRQLRIQRQRPRRARDEAEWTEPADLRDPDLGDDADDTVAAIDAALDGEADQ